ncbi:hypothetical protein P8868_18210 [Bacillus inaquosorum]|uniref:hypothetical protein n=1 Tax=Bacillus inaquosorum TaxID=483913 RepID=UPI0022802A81|nr:hypothetical protein [Bacillus inaquosorum]MCY8375466.1 hypothetical protein [Bacillus inaquosorum]MCY9058391.1 hypothetical protein [Bacillus inaquosorum]MCY9260326.1 hypothetical protein [Bacillus spizizenii]MEC0559482.1 hypothetical protein [Bacillus inaquosorum]
MKFSKKLTDKVTELKALQEKYTTQYEGMRTHNEKVSAELTSAEQDLAAAIEALAEEPSEENRSKEKDARRRVAELRLEVSGASERQTTVFRSKSAQISGLKSEILELARKEIVAHKTAKEDAALERIAAAKREYLEAAKAYHDLLIIDGQKKFYELVDEIGANEVVAKENEPGFSIHHPIYTDRESGANKYGIIEPEVFRAWNRGVVE